MYILYSLTNSHPAGQLRISGGGSAVKYFSRTPLKHCKGKEKTKGWPHQSETGVSNQGFTTSCKNSRPSGSYGFHRGKVLKICFRDLFQNFKDEEIIKGDPHHSATGDLNKAYITSLKKYSTKW